MGEFVCVSGFTRFLISTDLLGRGIDVQPVTRLVSYDMLKVMQQYLHRRLDEMDGTRCRTD